MEVGYKPLKENKGSGIRQLINQVFTTAIFLLCTYSLSRFLNYFLRKNFHKVGQVDARVELLGRFLIVKYVYGSTGGTLLEVTGSGR